MTDIYRRTFDADLEVRDVDGRPTVAGRIVPIGEEATIVEPDRTYRERFLPGCSTRVRQQAARLGHCRWVQLNLEHSDTIDHRIGYATSIDERPDGVYATFGLFEHAGLDKVRSMLRESHTGLSIEFADAAEPVTVGDLVSRRQIHLRGVAATPVPAYAGAVITSVREAGSVDDGTPRLDAAIKLLEQLRGATSAA
jgi:hypothetical protein